MEHERYCGEGSLDRSLCVIFDNPSFPYLIFRMYRINSCIREYFGFLEGPTWADDMIRKGFYPTLNERK